MDPFNDVQKDAELQINSLQDFLAKLSGSITEDTRIDFENSSIELQETLNDLAESIEISENNPESFGLTADDITKRKRIINDLEFKFNQLKDQWFGKLKPSAPKPREITSMSNRISQEGNPFLRYDEYEANNSEIPQNPQPDQFQHFQQQELIREQDQQLDGVYVTMQNLHQQARTIGEELEDQGYLLDDLDGELDTVGAKLNRGMKRVQYVIEKNRERASDCCIGILVVALVILLVMVIMV